MSLPRWLRVLGVFAAVLIQVGATGCFNPFSPRVFSSRGTSSPPPVPNSPEQVIELFAWCWRNRAYQEYREVFTDDFRFQYSLPDSAGQVGRRDFLDRTAELETARHLFIAGSDTGEPPARSISLEFGSALRSEPDGRDGKEEPWHAQIATDVLLRIDTGEQTFNVLGRATFFLVRGDSALIPSDLTSFRRDSTRWWIERWEDYTEGGEETAASAPRLEVLSVTSSRNSGAIRPARAANPAMSSLQEIDLTWGQLKLGYLGRRPPGALP